MARLKTEIRVRCYTCVDNYDIVVCVGGKVLFHCEHGWWERKPYAIRAAQKLSKETGISYNDKILNQHGC